MDVQDLARPAGRCVMGAVLIICGMVGGCLSHQDMEAISKGLMAWQLSVIVLVAGRRTGSS